MLGKVSVCPSPSTLPGVCVTDSSPRACDQMPRPWQLFCFCSGPALSHLALGRGHIRSHHPHLDWLAPRWPSRPIAAGQTVPEPLGPPEATTGCPPPEITPVAARNQSQKLKQPQVRTLATQFQPLPGSSPEVLPAP